MRTLLSFGRIEKGSFGIRDSMSWRIQSFAGRLAVKIIKFELLKYFTINLKLLKVVENQIDSIHSN